MTEKPSNFALIIVHISNDERLNADETDEFIMVPVDQYDQAVKVLRDAQKHKRAVIVKTIGAVKNRLDASKIDYEIIEIGTRVYLGIPEESKEDE
jgi:hypothetical protein